MQYRTRHGPLRSSTPWIANGWPICASAFPNAPVKVTDAQRFEDVYQHATHIAAACDQNILSGLSRHFLFCKRSPTGERYACDERANT